MTVPRPCEMRPVRLADLPGCAWTLDLANTDRRLPRWRRFVVAVLRVGAHAMMLALAAGAFHLDRTVVACLYRQGAPSTRSDRRRVASVGLLLVSPVVALGLAALTLPPASARWLVGLGCLVMVLLGVALASLGWLVVEHLWLRR